MTLTIFMFFVLVCLVVAVGIIACRHGFSRGYEQRAAEAQELDTAFAEMEHKLRKTQEQLRRAEVKNANQAKSIAEQNYFNLGLCERCNELKARVKELETKLKQR